MCIESCCGSASCRRARIPIRPATHWSETFRKRSSSPFTSTSYGTAARCAKPSVPAVTRASYRLAAPTPQRQSRANDYIDTLTLNFYTGHIMQNFKFTEKAQDAIVEAQPLAEQHNNASVDVEHLLVALLNQPEGVVTQLVLKLGQDLEQLRAGALTAVERIPKVYGGSTQVYMAPALRKVIDRAQELARTLKDEFVSTEHLFLGIADPQTEGPAGNLLRERGITRDKIFEALTAVRGNQRVTDPNPEGKYQALEKYGRDLTDLARKGKIDPVIGREEEIRRVIQVLSRRTKNNPVL